MYTGQKAAQAKKNDAHQKEQKRVWGKTWTDNHLLLRNTTENSSEGSGIQDGKKKDNFYFLDEDNLLFPRMKVIWF